MSDISLYDFKEICYIKNESEDFIIKEEFEDDHYDGKDCEYVMSITNKITEEKYYLSVSYTYSSWDSSEIDSWHLVYPKEYKAYTYPAIEV